MCLEAPLAVSKCLQLLDVIDYLHTHWIVHRDLKLSNLLLTNDGRLKLCDYGLARYFKAYEEAYTPKVVTLWYRCASHSTLKFTSVTFDVLIVQVNEGCRRREHALAK